MELLGTHPIDGAAEVVIQDQYAYVAVSGVYKETAVNAGGLAVVDWTEPTEPRTVYSRTFGAPLTPDAPPNLRIDTPDVKVAGDVAGVANDGNPGGVAFFDVSDPEQPEHVSFYDVSTEDRPLGTVHNLFLDGEYAYVGVNATTAIDSDEDGQPDQLRPFGETGVDIVDVSDPTTPTRVSTWKLKEFPGPAFAKAGLVNGFHDVYVQDGLAYICFWDAGIVVLDVSNPSAPELAAHFGEAPGATKEVRFFEIGEEDPEAYLQETGQLTRQLTLPGNAHYVQPSPDGLYVYVGAEAFGSREPGGIDIWDVSDLGKDIFAGPNRIGHISPPDIDLSLADQEYLDANPVIDTDDSRGRDLLRTSHNFDVTTDRLYTSWYGGGVRVFDITDPSTPTEIGVYDPEGASFWTAVAADETIVASEYRTGLVFLKNPNS
ncbi:LVIVD repeat-containing protein [Halorussus salinisoli]|uniref:LVIVD repeat-containing protein n=1 Tax=Halorussus salinisoli TaxID=2558242 RepID=UPI0014854FFC|nr:hypothetical protein [Halorussus salinisoli]